jgi:hypothetical protein
MSMSIVIILAFNYYNKLKLSGDAITPQLRNLKATIPALPPLSVHAHAKDASQPIRHSRLW